MRHDRVLRQLESHSKECVESLDRFLIGPNHHHHHQNSCVRIHHRSSSSNDPSTLVLSNVQDCCSIQYPISNPIESVVMIHPSIHPCERASKRVRERTLKRKVDLCQVWNLGRLPQVPSSTTIHIPSDHSSNQSKQQSQQQHNCQRQQQDPQPSKILDQVIALAVLDRDRLVGRCRREHPVVDKHRAIRFRLISLRASSECDVALEAAKLVHCRKLFAHCECQWTLS